MSQLTTLEKELRTLLRSQSPRLAGLTLAQAVELTAQYYRSRRAFELVEADGDGFVTYQDLTNHGRGSRLEIGLIRLFRLQHQAEDILRQCPAVRLRYRLCYRVDHDVFTKVLAAGTWSLYCWSPDQLDAMLAAVRETPAFKVLADRMPSEANISLEDTTYWRSRVNPEPERRQMWWGVYDVA